MPSQFPYLVGGGGGGGGGREPEEGGLTLPRISPGRGCGGIGGGGLGSFCDIF